MNVLSSHILETEAKAFLLAFFIVASSPTQLNNCGEEHAF